MSTSTPSSQPNATPSRSTVAIAASIDLICVVVFVLIGRRSHDEGILSLGSLNAIWPFVVGLAVGWLIARAWRRPLGVLNPGLVIWVSTVAIGMLLRWASGQGVQLSFVIVASIFTALFLLGWRLLSLALGSRRRTSSV